MGRSWRQQWMEAAVVLGMSRTVFGAYKLNLNSTDSIKAVARQLTYDMMSFYTGNQSGQVPGLLPQPYYWWEAGAVMGSLVDYWYYTGDSSYNEVTTQALLHQVGPYNDYMPPNQTLTEGNDDQGFWAMSVMSAAEYNFPNPPKDKPQWLALAQAVFNTQAARWDPHTCGGGLRWQIFTWNNGFNYKNSISQATFFNVAARLALYTGNSTYADWAVKTWDWMVNVGFIDKYWYIYDGAHIEDNCTNIIPYQFSYNPGAFLHGAAAMYAYANSTDHIAHGGTSDQWRYRVDGLLNGTAVFFQGEGHNIMSEVACEPVNLCNLDQQSFKAYLSRWMAATTKWAPWTYDRIKSYLEASATAAVKQCTSGNNGRMCGLKWANNNGTSDGNTGIGQQMAAMEVVLGNMIRDVSPPVTNSTGGTSVGDPSAGGSDSARKTPYIDGWHTITPGDQFGGALLTILTLFGLFAGMFFMMMDEDKTVKETMVSTKEWFLRPSASVIAARGAAAAAAANMQEKGKYSASPSDRSSSFDDKFPSAYRVRENRYGSQNIRSVSGAIIGRESETIYEPQRRLSGRPRRPSIVGPEHESRRGYGVGVGLPRQARTFSELPRPPTASVRRKALHRRNRLSA